MKKKLLVFLIVILGIFSAITYASDNKRFFRFSNRSKYLDENEELKTKIISLKNKYGIKTKEKLDYKKLTKEELNNLGEILMTIMIPDEEEHEYMDEMMGGDDSESLSIMHRRMAINYLDNDGFGFCGFGRWHGFGFMRGMMGGNRGMMYDDWDDSEESQEDYLSILKRRLANGEITKKEYKELKELLDK